MASDSNLTLHAAMQLHVTNLKLLAQPISEISDSLPSLEQLQPHTKQSLADMRRIMAKVRKWRSNKIWFSV